jgi:hypothetical protein
MQTLHDSAVSVTNVQAHECQFPVMDMPLQIILDESTTCPADRGRFVMRVTRNAGNKGKQSDKHDLFRPLMSGLVMIIQVKE